MRSPSRSRSVFVAIAAGALVASVVVAAAPASSDHVTSARVEHTATCLQADGPSAELASPGLRVSLEEFDRLLRTGKVIVIDVREEEAYLQAHVPEAVSIPLDQLEASVTRLRAAGLRVVTYCASTTCERSARAAMMLRRLGVPEVQALDGGFPAWVASGRVVVVQPTS